MERGGSRPRSRDGIWRDARTRLSASAGASFNADDDPARLLYELQVHQVELEMQNDELRRAQADLEESRDRYWALYDLAPCGYLTLARNGVIVEANLTATKLLGIDRSQLVGRQLAGFMDRTDAQRFRLHQLTAARHGMKETCDVGLRRSNRDVIQVRLETIPETAAEEQRFRTVIVDISDLRRAEREVKQSEARFRQIAEHIEDVFYVHEWVGRISYVSPAFERIWARPAAWLAGRDTAWLDTIDLDDRGRVAAAWKRLRNGGTMSEVYRIRRPDGATRWVHSRGFAVEADHGRVVRDVGVVRDITHERALEDQVRHAQKMEAVGTLASGMAHNLRNVLQAVLGSIEFAQARVGEGTQAARALERAVSATQRGAALIDQLMTLAHKQEGEIELLPLRPDDVIRKAEGLLKSLVGDRVLLDIDTAAPADIVMSDHVQFEQILLNLAANARDAMPDGGTLSIRSRDALVDEPTDEVQDAAARHQLIVTVQDSGCGMDAATKAHIFEPFFTTKEVGKGTGLGLSTVFAVVRRFGGRIDVESAPGEGTTFSICLPARQSARLDASEPRV